MRLSVSCLRLNLKSPQQEQEVVELSSDDESLQPNSEEASDEEPEGDPNREPGADATKTIDPAHLVPFRFEFKALNKVWKTYLGISKSTTDLIRGEVFITFSRTLISSHHRRYSQVRLAEGGCHAEWGWWLHHVHPGLPQFKRYSNFASAGL